jgi:hypothetical protein
MKSVSRTWILVAVVGGLLPLMGCGGGGAPPPPPGNTGGDNPCPFGSGVEISFSAVQFGNVPVGTVPPTQTVTLTNTGCPNVSCTCGTLDISQILFTPTSSGDFHATTDCPNQLAIGTSCTISIYFEPTAAGKEQGTIIVCDDGTGYPSAGNVGYNGCNGQAIGVSGTGV